jgi:hypothetical protein
MRTLWPSEYFLTVAARALFKGWYAPELPLNRFPTYPSDYIPVVFGSGHAIDVGAAGSAAGIDGGGAIGAGVMGNAGLGLGGAATATGAGAGFGAGFGAGVAIAFLGAAFLGAAFFGADFAFDFPFALPFAFIGRDFFFAALFFADVRLAAPRLAFAIGRFFALRFFDLLFFAMVTLLLGDRSKLTVRVALKKSAVICE